MASEQLSYPILYVDDEAANLLTLKYSLDGKFRVLTADSGEKAIELLKTEEVAVLLTDQRMPGMTGVELCARVRDMKPRVIRIILTAYADVQDAIAAINLGHVSHYIAKPFQEEELVEAISSAIDLFRSQRRHSALTLDLATSGPRQAVDAVQDELAHELSNYLAGLSGLVDEVGKMMDEVLENASDPAKIKSLVESARQTQRDAGDGVEQLRQMSTRLRTRRGDQIAKKMAVNASEIVRSTARIARTEIEQAATLEVQADRVICTYMEESTLGQVLMNLLINARQALSDDKHGRIRISVSDGPRTDQLQIDVEDSGIGIPVHQRENVLRPYFTTKAEGCGLGLSIARKLVENEDGSIEIRSSELGGAHIAIVLPTAPCPEATPE
ncbi:MAG: hybrid sensor histidine kinase/response regulator [Myxococcota bacterium]